MYNFLNSQNKSDDIHGKFPATHFYLIKHSKHEKNI